MRLGRNGTVAVNEPVEREKDLKRAPPCGPTRILHNTLDMADVARELEAAGRPVGPLDLAQVSPYLTEHIGQADAVRKTVRGPGALSRD